MDENEELLRLWLSLCEHFKLLTKLPVRNARPRGAAGQQAGRSLPAKPE
jgi:hypothetical protein